MTRVDRFLHPKEKRMPIYVHVVFKNDTTSQHVYTITDDVLGQQIVNAQPLAADESVDTDLVADENNHGRATYGYSGGDHTSRTDLNDGDIVLMG
jgi:hypothetical protein